MISADFEPFAEFLESKASTWSDGAVEAIYLAGGDFKGYVQANQWGGRPGLMIQSANLWNSMIVTARRADQSVIGGVDNVNASYWWYHDVSGLNGAPFMRDTLFGKPVDPYQVVIPARTDLYGRFETVGLGFYEERVGARLSGVFG